eukprot:3699282-Prorocentrum_lima.AAC.1
MAEASFLCRQRKFILGHPQGVLESSAIQPRPPTRSWGDFCTSSQATHWVLEGFCNSSQATTQ